MGKATRLDKYCKGWTGAKYVRKLAARTRRRMERAQLRKGSEDIYTPNVCASGYAS